MTATAPATTAHKANRLKARTTPFPAIVDKDGTVHPDLAAIPARLNKRDGAAFVTQFYYPTTPRSFERLPIKAVVINGTRYWATRDTIACARGKLAMARPSHPTTRK